MESKRGNGDGVCHEHRLIEPVKPPWTICADRYLFVSVVKFKHLHHKYICKSVYLDDDTGVHVKTNVLDYSQHTSQMKSCRRRLFSMLSLTLC